MVNGAHVLLYSRDSEADRAFLRDVLGFPWVDVGHGWLIFKLPPAEVAVHPVEEGTRPADGETVGAELYLMCDDVRALVAELADRGVGCGELVEAPWGIRTSIALPSGGVLGLYEPRHPTALGL
jgi:hypothetical protein